MNETTRFGDDFGKLILRLSVGGLMLCHGVSKVQAGVPAGIAWMADALKSKGLPAELMYGAYVGEVLAPLFLIIGFCTRFSALMVASTMVFAVYLVHMDDLTQLDAKTGAWKLELQGLYFLGSMALVFLGGGRFSATGARGLLS